MRIDIRVDKGAVLEGVSALSVYVARSVGQERAAVTESDGDALEQLWLDGVSVLSRMLSEWTHGESGWGVLKAPYVSGDYAAALDVPENWDIGKVESVTAAMHRYMVKSMMHGWLVMHGVDRAGVYGQEASSVLDELRELLSVRVRPRGCVEVCRCGRKNVARIVLDRDTLLGDIGQRAWVLSDVTQRDAAEARHQTADVVSGGNLSITLRELDLTWYELEESLYAFVSRPDGWHGSCDGTAAMQRYTGRGGDGAATGSHHTGQAGADFGVVDDSLPGEDRYEVSLELPEGVTESSVRYWRVLMHEYMVTKVLAMWTGMVNAEKQPGLLIRAADLRGRLSVSLTSRARRVHRPGRPW